MEHEDGVQGLGGGGEERADEGRVGDVAAETGRVRGVRDAGGDGGFYEVGEEHVVVWFVEEAGGD